MALAWPGRRNRWTASLIVTRALNALDVDNDNDNRLSDFGIEPSQYRAEPTASLCEWKERKRKTVQSEKREIASVSSSSSDKISKIHAPGGIIGSTLKLGVPAKRVRSRPIAKRRESSRRHFIGRSHCATANYKNASSCSNCRNVDILYIHSRHLLWAWC